MVDGEKEEEELTMVVRVLSLPPPQGLAFQFADGHVEPITELAAVTGETYIWRRWSGWRRTWAPK